VTRAAAPATGRGSRHHGRTRARRGDGELLHVEIVAAAARLLAETGDEDAVSIRAVAAAVGVTPPSIYLHFADKTALMYAVCEERFTALDREIEKAAARASDPLDEIRRRGEAYVRFGLDNPEQYRILFMGRPRPPLWNEERLRTASAFEHLVEAVQRAIDAGVVPTQDPVLVALGLWASVHGITSLMIAKPEFPWPPVKQIIDHQMATYVRGLMVDPQAGPATPAAPTKPASPAKEPRRAGDRRAKRER
jgi:AcrR family transcriptional regulator